MNYNEAYTCSSIGSFMYFKTDQFAQNFFFVNLFSYFVSICNIYEVKLLSNSVKWSMRPFPREGEGVNYK